MEWEGGQQRPRAPSTPTSELSHSTSSSREKVPPYKQLNPSPVMSALSKLSDDDLFRKGGDEILRMLRRVESDYKNLLSEHSGVVKDVNRRFQIFVLEGRGLKEINQKLQDDNQELRDLCCFLDDDRQRSRKLAREWQRFGRYTASVMHSEVAAYQEKLKQLEDRQAELLSDNMELKELCLFLDHERSQMSGDRDDGDGSSSGTVPGQEDTGQSQGDSDGQVTPTPTPTPSQQPSSSADSHYVRQLELKIQRLEEEKKQLAQRVERNGAEGYHPADQDRALHSVRQDSAQNQAGEGRQGAVTPGRDRATPTSSVNKPEAVVHAMKVLQVHEQLERQQDTKGSEDLETPQKAIVREMCNVVWRKLGDVGEYPPHTLASTPFSTTPPQPHPQHPYRPQSAAGNPIPSSSSQAGGPPPPPLSRSHPSPHTFSPTDGPSPYLDIHGNLHRGPPPPTSSAGGGGGGGGAPSGEGGSGRGLGGLDHLGGPGPQSHWVERRGGGGGGSGQGGLQAPRQAGGVQAAATSPGRREDNNQRHHSPGGGMMGMMAERRDHMTGRGGGWGENFPPGAGGGGGGGGRANPGGGGGGGGGGYTNTAIGSHPPPPPPPERQRQMHPPPYSSSKSCPTLIAPGHPPPSQQQHQPPPPPSSQGHHQPPPSRQQPQHQQQPPPPPTHRQQQQQQRIHPLHQPPTSSSSSPNQGQHHHHHHHHQLPRSVSGPATYYVGQPIAQSKPHPQPSTMTTTMPSYHQPPTSPYMYTQQQQQQQRGGGGGGGEGNLPPPPFRSAFPPGEQGGSRPTGHGGGEMGRPERRQTYLND